MFSRLFALLLISILSLSALSAQLAAQDAAPVAMAEPELRTETGGAQTREDIMARQRGEKVDYDFRRTDTGNPESAADPTGQLGTLGGISDSEMFRSLRYGSAKITTTDRGPASDVIIQDGGMNWLILRDNKIARYGGWLLLGIIGVLALFYMLRGAVPIEGERTGRTIERFKAFERGMHWMTAVSFILLAITGLISMFGRPYLINIMGHEAHAWLAMVSKYIHNYVSWVFMLGVLLIFFKWVRFNIPNWNDVKWLMVMGGLFSHHHPPAGKFNMGQKIIFWTVIFLSICVTVTGLSLLMPFRAPVFADLFAWVNSIGIPGWFGVPDLPAALSPQQEMQYTQLVHASVAFLFMAMIIGHIYIGTIGMEGAFDAMKSGHVEERWAKEHHSIWYDEVKAAEAEATKPSSDPQATPAE